MQSWHPLHDAETTETAPVSHDVVPHESPPKREETHSESAPHLRLRLTLPPHRLSNQELANQMNDAPMSQLPSDLALYLCRTLSQQVEEESAAKELYLRTRTAQLDALVDLVREETTLSDQLIARTLLRSATHVLSHSGQAANKWELDVCLDPNAWTARPPNTLHMPPYHRPRERQMERVDNALGEAMSERAFELDSNVNETLSARPPSSQEPVLSQAHSKSHSSFAARLLGLSRNAGETKHPAATGPVSRTSKPSEPEENDSIKSKKTVLQEWASNVLHSSSPMTSIAQEQLTSPNCQDLPENVDPGTSVESIESARAALSTVPPSAPVAALLSKRQLDTPVLSLPVVPVPSLSNPGSVQATPLAPTFSVQVNSSRRSSSSLSSFGPPANVNGVVSGSKTGEQEEGRDFVRKVRSMSTTSLTSQTFSEDDLGPASAYQPFAEVSSLFKNGSDKTRSLQPPVTLPTLGSTRTNSVFQTVLGNTSSSSINSGNPTAACNYNDPAGTLELNTISSSEVIPPAYTTPDSDSTRARQLVDRYGFLHEKNGMKIYRELQQRQQEIGDKTNSDPIEPPSEARTSDREGVSSVKRLLTQLDDMNDAQEANIRTEWDKYLRKRQIQAVQDTVDASPARKDRSTKSSAGPILALPRDSSAEETLLSGDLIGIARMGVSGKSGKEAWRNLRHLVRSGIPISYRGSVWAELSGASEAKEPGYYAELLEKHEDGHDSLSLKQINADIGRTFGSNIFFGGAGPGVAKLRRILVAYSWHNPEVGYCQGMNLIAGTLLLALPSEEDVFWILCCIIERILPSDYFTPSLLVSRADQRVLRALVGRHLPRISAHLDILDVELEAVTFGWYLSLFALPLPIRTLLRVLDIFFCDGVVVLFRISLAILQLHQAEILACDSASDMYVLLRTMTGNLHQADKLIKIACQDFKLKNKDVVLLREQILREMSAFLALSHFCSFSPVTASISIKLKMDIDVPLDDVIAKKKARGGRGRGRGRAATRSVSDRSAVRQKYSSAVPAQSPAAAAKSPLAGLPGDGSKIVVSNLPDDVSENQIRELFDTTVGRVKRISLAYNSSGKSAGIATIEFVKAGDGSKAFHAYNNRLIDQKRPMKVEIIVDPTKIPPPPLSSRVAPAAKATAGSNKAEAAPAGDTEASTTRGKGGRGRGRGRRGRAKNSRPAATAEELDAEMDSYLKESA